MLHRIEQISSTLLAFIFCLTTKTAYTQSTIKIIYTNPLSGPFAQIGNQNLQQFKYIIDYINGHSGALGRKFELISFDNKSQPSEALLALKSATDQNIPMIIQCSGSNIAAALIEDMDKHNERNPSNRIVYVNCNAVATELTNEKCSYQHFRMNTHMGMKAKTIMRALPKDMTKVYLLNQDYLFGQSVQRDVKTFLTKLRPNVKVVDDELIPLGKMKDFSPYITKIKASNAQALLTGNQGPDMTLLIKSGMNAGLDIRYYTIYTHLNGRATAIGPTGNGKMRSVMAFHENITMETDKTDTEGWTKQFRTQHDFNFYAANFRTIFEFLQTAINKASSADPMKFSAALKKLTITDMLGYQITMRKADHQILNEYFVGVFTKNMKYDSEKTGLSWKTETTIQPKDLDQPNTCNMKRPASQNRTPSLSEKDSA